VPTPSPLVGFVDLHAHPMSSLGFASKLMYGGVDDTAARTTPQREAGGGRHAPRIESRMAADLERRHVSPHCIRSMSAPVPMRMRTKRSAPRRRLQAVVRFSQRYGG
jgi:hypothetical protein